MSLLGGCVVVVVVISYCMDVRCQMSDAMNPLFTKKIIVAKRLKVKG